MNIKQWSAAALVAAAVLSVTACSAPSAEGNAKKVVELLTENKTDDAKKLMTEYAQKSVGARSGLEVLGNTKMNEGCKASDGTKSEEAGATVVSIPYDCGDSKFTIRVQVKDNLVDRINYAGA